MMNNQISERRIRNNRIKRRREMRRNIIMSLLTIILIAGISTVFFSVKAKAQSAPEDISYKYYKSITIEAGNTIWDFANQYADKEFYDSFDSYIEEVIQINHLQDENIIAGQNIIIPYYSREFV
ncbi:MAG: LysM peptidoglycan-binding domain-containing protein [Lachnospiraceae bacterium]|nr:LysM peptidoglycan-binding domain-containing protein [Lachnospiraceae bacterium]